MDIYININETPNAKGLVFIQHGTSGYKEEKHLKRIEETFIKAGYTTINFDATNSRGESESDEIGITFTGHYQDLEDVINRTKTQPRYKEPFTLVGHSLGGMSVIYYTENHPNEIKTLFAIAPLLSGKNFVKSRKARSTTDFEEREKN
jgi:alpha-beta hydrolase superfamily lysophospholipase